MMVLTSDFPWRTYPGGTSSSQLVNFEPSPFLRSVSWASKMAQQVKVLAAKPDHLSFTLGPTR